MHRLAKMYSLVSSSHEAELQSQFYCEQRAAQYSDTFNPAGGRRLCVVVETTNNEGHLCLFDLSSNASLGKLSFYIYLRSFALTLWR